MNGVHPAEEYLRNPENTHKLYVIIEGKKRKLFVNDKHNGPIGIIDSGKRKTGTIFTGWNKIEKILYPSLENELSTEEREKKLILKYQKLAKQATFSNSWLDSIANADLTKDLYKNGITTGTSIDGKCIKVETLKKYFGADVVEMFLNAVREKKNFNSGRYDFQGYDGTLWVFIHGDDVKAGLNKEYRNCGNGYYYLLINEKTFIGYDID